MFSAATERLIDIALEEDIGAGDITTLPIIGGDAAACAFFLAKEPLVVCGHEVARRILNKLDPLLRYQIVRPDGTQVEDGAILAEFSGSLRAILSGERTALNFLQRLCGVAAASRRAAKLVQDLPVRLLDTRKTTPGLRELEKYAVTVGGCSNHRFGLYDAVLIKNNHIDAVNGDIGRAVRLCRENSAPGTKIEVEVRDFDELEQAVAALPDAILLDNMDPPVLRQAVKQVRAAEQRPIELEASGGISESNLRAYAETGVDSVSLGALTHSVKAADISLRYRTQG